MLLAVAGLSKDEIKQRTEKLSAGDWSDFPPSERLAFGFAHQLTSKPAGVSAANVQSMVDAFGEHRAMDLIWYTSWCNYMTRVADAFQLPLEKENVFARPKEKPKKDPKKAQDKDHP